MEPNNGTLSESPTHAAADAQGNETLALNAPCLVFLKGRPARKMIIENASKTEALLRWDQGIDRSIAEGDRCVVHAEFQSGKMRLEGSVSRVETNSESQFLSLGDVSWQREEKEQRAGLRVLLVDDEPNNLNVLERFLTREGHEVFRAEDGETAVESAVTNLPDLILMDLGLPGMNGFEATRKIKSDPKTAHIPVIALTAYTSMEHVKEALEAGCAHYETKPLAFSRLMKRLREYSPARRPQS